MQPRALSVLHLIPYMHPAAGGPPVVVDRWCTELRPLGWNTEVLTTNAYEDGGDPGWRELSREHYPLEVTPLRGPRGFGYSAELRQSLRRRLRQVALVHVHNIWSYCNRIAAIECCRAGVPFLVSSHGMLDPNSMGRKPWKKRLYGRLFEWRQLRRAAGIVFTHAEEERLARRTCASLPKGYIVPLGTDDPPPLTRTDLCERFLQRWPALAETQRVVFLGRLHSKKGLDLLVPAFARVIREFPSTHLLLVGPGESGYVQSLRDLISRRGLEPHVTIMDAVAGEQKWQVLAAGDVFVLPSYQENFAISLVEAVRVGTPVITSRRVNIWQDLEQAGAAIVCDLNEESVAAGITDLLRDPQCRDEMGARGSVFAARRYTWKNSAAELHAVYEHVLQGGQFRTPADKDRSKVPE